MSVSEPQTESYDVCFRLSLTMSVSTFIDPKLVTASYIITLNSYTYTYLHFFPRSFTTSCGRLIPSNQKSPKSEGRGDVHYCEIITKEHACFHYKYNLPYLLNVKYLNINNINNCLIVTELIIVQNFIFSKLLKCMYELCILKCCRNCVLLSKKFFCGFVMIKLLVMYQ